MPQASRVEEELKKAFNANVLLNASSGGIFDIEVNGKIIFSKKNLIGVKTNRFPNDEEITKIIQNL